MSRLRLMTILILLSFTLFSGCANTAVSVWDGVLRDTDSSPIGVTDGSLDVAVQDQDTNPVNLYLSRKLSNFTLEKNYTVGQQSINITTNVTPQVDNFVCLKENQAFFQARVTSVTPIAGNNYNINLSMPIDYNFTTEGACSIRSSDLTVNGENNVTEFIVSPKGMTNNTKWDIYQLCIHFVDDTTMDDGLFAGIPSLSKGIYFKNSNGAFQVFGNMQKNGDYREQGFEVEYIDKAPSGQYAMIACKHISDSNGVSLRLSADNLDTFSFVVQDDLTGITNGEATIQGHVVE